MTLRRPLPFPCRPIPTSRPVRSSNTSATDCQSKPKSSVCCETREQDAPIAMVGWARTQQELQSTPRSWMPKTLRIAAYGQSFTQHVFHELEPLMPQASFVFSRWARCSPQPRLRPVPRGAVHGSVRRRHRRNRRVQCLRHPDDDTYDAQLRDAVSVYVPTLRVERVQRVR